MPGVEDDALSVVLLEHALRHELLQRGADGRVRRRALGVSGLELDPDLTDLLGLTGLLGEDLGEELAERGFRGLRVLLCRRRLNRDPPWPVEG